MIPTKLKANQTMTMGKKCELIWKYRSYDIIDYYIDRLYSKYQFTKTRSKSDKMHTFEDVPVAEIDSGKFGTPLVWEAEPGDAIAFHGRTIHGAPGNSCQNRHRRVLSLRWLGEVYKSDI